MTDASVCPHTGAAGYGYWVVSERSPGTHGQGGLILKGYKDSFSGELHGVYLSIKESIENGKILQNCKDCRLQMAFRLAEIKKTEL